MKSALKSIGIGAVFVLPLAALIQGVIWLWPYSGYVALVALVLLALWCLGTAIRLAMGEEWV